MAKTTQPKSKTNNKDLKKPLVNESLFSYTKDGFIDVQKQKEGDIFQLENDTSGKEYSIRSYSGEVEVKGKTGKPILQNRTINYLVYKFRSSDPWLIDETQALALAACFGYKPWNIDEIISVPLANGQVRYVMKASIREPQHLGGREYSHVANACFDNVGEGFDKYAPEIAAKRSIVRVILRAMKIFDCSFEGEFSTQLIPITKQVTSVSSQQPSEEQTIISDVEIQKQRTRQVDSIRNKMVSNKKYGGFTEAQICKKFNKVKLEECSSEELVTIITGLNQVAAGNKG